MVLRFDQLERCFIVHLYRSFLYFICLTKIHPGGPVETGQERSRKTGGGKLFANNTSNAQISVDRLCIFLYYLLFSMFFILKYYSVYLNWLIVMSVGFPRI